MMSAPHRLPVIAALVALAFGRPLGGARAIDGTGLSAQTTYYQDVVGTAAPSELESTSPGLPTSLQVSDSTATLQYASTATEDGDLEWTVRVRGLLRNHERVDAVYHMIAVLPVPVDADGRDAFKPLQWGITPREGAPGASVPLIYAGEKLVLKRSRALERTLLPRLVGPDSGQLPSLDGTGYRYGLWDAIIRYDPGYGDSVQVFTDFRYITGPGVAAPDGRDERLKAYVVTWIPALDPSVAPFAVRMDVRDPE